MAQVKSTQKLFALRQLWEDLDRPSRWESRRTSVIIPVSPHLDSILTGQPEQNRNMLRFGVFELDAVSADLTKNGARVRLQDQPARLLLHLLEHRGEVVTREQLHRALWPADTFVDFDHGLNTAVSKIRDVLGDSSSSPVLSRRCRGRVTGSSHPWKRCGPYLSCGKLGQSGSGRRLAFSSRRRRQWCGWLLGAGHQPLPSR